MGMQLEFIRHPLCQLFFHREHVFAGCNTGAVGNAKNVRIDRDGRLPERDIEDDAGGFAAHARQLHELFAAGRYCAGVAFEQQLAGRQDIFRLGAVEPNALDVFFQPCSAKLQDGRGCIGRRVEFARGQVDALVSGLGRQYDCHQQLKRVAVFEFAARFRIGGAQPAENFSAF